MKIIIYSRQASTQCGSQLEVLRKSIESRGDKIVGIVADDPAIVGRGKYAGWRAIVDDLAQIDQIVIGSAGDLPGKSVADLLKILAVLNDHDVGLCAVHEGIDTCAGPSALLDLITAYRAAKLSEAIRAGQAKARKAGKILGRPPVPDHIKRRIADAMATEPGIRTTARQFGVSPGTIINIRRIMSADQGKLAA